MGPPKATLEKGQFAIDFKYSYQEMDLELDGKARAWNTTFSTWDCDYTDYKIEALTSNMFLGSVEYGICDNWDVFGHVGAADAEDEIAETLVCGASGNQYHGFSGDYGLAWGFGTRATFCREDDLTWGGIFQMT